jgi:hypothetical protein
MLHSEDEEKTLEQTMETFINHCQNLSNPGCQNAVKIFTLLINKIILVLKDKSL